MKAYLPPYTEIVVICNQERFMGTPQGSYYVDTLDPETPVVIGDDDGSVNTYNVSLWDEE